jgi:hypothetical protein
MNQRYKYKLYSSVETPIHLIERGTKKPHNEDYGKFLNIPTFVPDHQLFFTGSMVRSGKNKNRAYFDQVEMIKAYHTIPFNAVDIEHDQEKNCGTILNHVFVDVKTGNQIDMEQAANLPEEKIREFDIDAVILAVLWEDRYPAYGNIVANKRTALSMETYLQDFDIIMENGVRLSQDEALLLGLGDFLDQLMSNFETREEFDRAHSLMVTFADGKKKAMEIYKYLKSLQFSGVGLVNLPACEQCTLISTNRDDCECEDLKAAASVLLNSKPQIKEFELDLRQVDSYMKKIRDNKEIPAMNIQVAETIKPEEVAQVIEEPIVEDRVEETAIVIPTVESNVEVETAEQIDTIRDAPPTMVPPPSTLPKTPNDMTSKPSQCPQYRYQEEVSCLFANATCEAVGDRKDKSCRRWFQDEKGIWKFDSRNNITDDEEIVVNENMEDPGELDDETAKRKHLDWLSKKIESLEYALESFNLEREVAQSNLSEKAATWTTQYINGLPNSSFAVVETGYKEGDNKNARHLPFKDGSGKVDLPHLRNALARANQIKNVLGKDSDADLRARAQRKLAPFAKRYLKTNKED